MPDTIFLNRFVLLLVFVTALSCKAGAGINNQTPADSSASSTLQQAQAFVDNIQKLERSAYWPGIDPSLFLQNLKKNVHSPTGIYAGNGTNFCGYGALTYLFLKEDPLGYVKLLLRLYKTGKAKYGHTSFSPSRPVRMQAGLLHFKGVLDILPAEQMWFLSLADHFKGYLNFFNRNYDRGDEDRLWAAVNYAKFNRMIRKLLPYKTKAKGADLIRPRVKDLYEYISTQLKNATVAMYINNRIVHKKNHVSIKIGFPTHFIIAENISMTNGLITFVYWDYGHKTLLQLSPHTFKQMIFGITACTKTPENED